MDFGFLFLVFNKNFVSELRKKIVYNATFSGIVKVIDTFLALVITALLTRYLGPAGFGDYIIIFTFWYIFMVLADLGLYSITVRDISQNDGRESEIISNALTLRMVSTAAIFLFGIAAVFFFPYKIEIKIGVIIASFGFWALFSAQVLLGLFQKKLSIDKTALADMLGRAAQLALVIFFIKGNYSLLSIIAAFSVSAFIIFIANIWFVRKFVSLVFAADFKIWKKMIREGWPLALSAILVMLYFRLNIITLSLIKGEEAVGYFGAAYKVLENVIFFPAMLVGLAMPIMSKAAKEDMEKFKDIINKVSKVLIILLVPLAAITVVLSGEIIQIIAGRNFGESAAALNILIFAAAVIFLATLWSNAIIALGKQRQLVKIYFWGAAVNFAANLILIPRFSYIGAAWSTLATEFFVTWLMAAYLYKSIRYIPQGLRLLKIISSAVIAAALIYLIKKALYFDSPFLILGALLPVGAMAYFLLLYFSGGFRIGELGFLRKNEK